MKKYFVSGFLGICVFLSACQREQLMEYSLEGGDKLLTLVLKDEHLGSGLELSNGSPGKSGVIWFETEDRKWMITGTPLAIVNDENHFEAFWKIDNREIEIDVSRENGYYTFSFTSSPASGILKWGLSIAASEDEYFTGLFERTVDGNQSRSWKAGITEGMDLRGQEVEMLIKPTLSLYCPFYLSSRGYGLFVEGTWPGKYDFCRTDPDRVKIEFEGPSLSGRIYTAANPAEIVKAHALHVGPSIVPPKWAFLPWRWRDEHVNRERYYDNTPVRAPYNSEVVEDILMMEAFDIPCGVYWVDRPWALGERGYDDFEWDPERFPRAEDMISWLHDRNIKFILWIAPWVSGTMKDTAEALGYALPMRTHYGVSSKNAALLDLTNADACRWWQQEGIEKMLAQGVDGFKLDRAEETVPESRKVILSDGRTAREVRNAYPVLYVKTVNESCRRMKGDDFVLIPRAGYTGSSKYSGFWGGDIGSPPEGLRAAIIAVQRSAVMGFPVWGSDIGGYWQGDLDREVCARWLAFGCFNPIMEVGPTENRAPWNMDSEPAYDTELIAIWRFYAKLHASMADYSYMLAQEAHRTGMPVVRPLFLEFPEQKEAWRDWESFMYGPDILVHAIWEKGKDEAEVYLPAGSRWRDAWNKETVHEGGQVVQVKTPLHKIPVFIREGAGTDLGDLGAQYRESLEKAEKKPDLNQLQQQYFK